ncbi:TonB-dependent receptor [Croceicoccus gelatinilyticus]|uniref:TonB-dependent receptor n=1 Tax=Croceicoccus gelatinilyticus TaxID=2835536 RepID=UPI001BCC027D|nr:TonB-dependent receptor [Croceicoccus gelatinilyticus]MBS7669085.1 TonB-dependent receptor [Croceicoccus gelatinilyticus]
MQSTLYPKCVLRGLATTTAIAAIAWATPGLAQESEDPPAAGDQVAANPNAIIVTARRRSETLQNTPVAITAIQPAALEAKGTLDIGDLQGTAPNLLITQQPTGSATANISIRGIAFADVEKSFDPAVGIYVDGVYIGTSTGQYLDFFDIESIEVLRGPQGTLFGRNTIAGVISIRRTKPTMEFGAKVETTVGSFGTWGMRGVLNVPIIEGELGVKFFEFHQQTDGYMRDGFTGQRLNSSNSENFGLAVRYNPSATFDATLTLERQDQTSKPYFASAMVPGDAFCGFVPPGACGGNLTDDLYTAYKVAEHSGFYKADGVTLDMEVGLGAVTVNSITSYRDSDESFYADFGTAGLFIAQRPQTYEQFSQELRFAGDLFGGFDYVAGLYYFESDYELDQSTFVFGAPAGGIGVIGHSESYAAFLDFNWEVFQDVRLSGGGRYTKDKKEYEFPLILSDSVKKSWSKFTPKLTIDWRPTPDMMLYGTWSRGYRSGGFSGRAGTPFSAQTPYDPETVDSFELGAKTEWLNGRGTFNVAGFYTDYKNIQQSTVITADNAQGNETIVVNAAGAKIKGVEADMSFEPLDGLNFSAAVGYTDSKFNGFIIGQPITRPDATIFLQQLDYSDVDPIFAPKWTLSLNGSYTIPVGEADVTLSAGYRYLAEYDQQIAPDPALYGALLAQDFSATPFVVPQNDPRVRSDAQNLLDASISAQVPMNDSGAMANFSLFVRNLLDDRGPSFAFAVAAYPNLWHYGVPREPRFWGASAGFEF